MSTLTNLAGLIGVQRDDNVGRDGTAPALSTSGLIDAAGEMVAFIGTIWHPTVKSGSINIRKVHFRLGATTFNVLSVFRVSFQDISATAGPPYQPDGTADQSYSYAGSGLTANGWNTTGAFDADRSVNLANDSFGDANARWFAVVFELTTFTALDSIIVNGFDQAPGGNKPKGSLSGAQVLLKTGGTWATLANASPVLALECDDGTFAFMRGAQPYSTMGSVASVASNGAIRRAGIMFQVPVQLKISTLSLVLVIPNGCDGRLVLYDSDGVTELVSVDVDNDAVNSTSVGETVIEFVPVTLTAATNYRFAFVAGTTTAASINYSDVNAAGLMDGMILGQNAMWTQHDGSNWSQTATRRPLWGIGISAVHDGSGGAGGVAKFAGSGGGFAA